MKLTTINGCKSIHDSLFTFNQQKILYNVQFPGLTGNKYTGVKKQLRLQHILNHVEISKQRHDVIFTYIARLGVMQQIRLFSKLSLCKRLPWLETPCCVLTKSKPRNPLVENGVATSCLEVCGLVYITQRLFRRIRPVKKMSTD